MAELANDRQQAERMAQLGGDGVSDSLKISVETGTVRCSTVTSRASRKERSVGPARMSCRDYGKSSSFQHSGSGQYQTDLERAEEKYQIEIEKWLKEVPPSKEENDALRKLVDDREAKEHDRTGQGMESGSKQDRRTTKGGGKRTGFLEDSQRRSCYADERELKRLGFQSQTARKGETRRIWKAGHTIRDAVKKDQTQIDEEYKRKLEQATSQLNQLRNLLTFRTGD